MANVAKASKSIGMASHVMPLKPPPTTSTTHLTHTTLFPPPTSLLHPTLLEKMRLGSPSNAHVHLSTLNRHQTENEISETFYKLHDASPFPKLPPYFVHKSNLDARGGDSGDKGSGQGAAAAAGIPLARGIHSHHEGTV